MSSLVHFAVHFEFYVFLDIKRGGHDKQEALRGREEWQEKEHSDQPNPVLRQVWGLTSAY